MYSFIREAVVSHYHHNFPSFCHQSPWQRSANRRTDLCISWWGKKWRQRIQFTMSWWLSRSLVTVTRRLGACHEPCDVVTWHVTSWHRSQSAIRLWIVNIADMLTCHLEHVLIVLIASSTLVTLLVSESMGTPATGSADHCLETPGALSIMRGRDYHDISNIYGHV